MPHIHTLPGEHDLTTSAYILRIWQGEIQVLLFYHKKRSIIMQPGGHVELHETPWQGVAHEISEEVGYRFDQLRVLQPTSYMQRLTGGILHPLPAMLGTYEVGKNGEHWHTDVAFAFITDQEPAGAGEGEEADELLWFSEPELRTLPDAAIIGNVREIALYVMTELYGSWQAVATDEFEA